MARVLVASIIVLAAFWFPDTECGTIPSEHQGGSKQPFMIRHLGFLTNWLYRLHSLLVEEPEKPERPAPPPTDGPTESSSQDPNVQSSSQAPRVQSSPPVHVRTVKLASVGHGHKSEVSSKDSPGAWVNFDRSRVDASALAGGVVIAAFRSHFFRPQDGPFHVRFLFDDTAPSDDSLGAYHIDGNVEDTWRPIGYAQMYAVPDEQGSVAVQIQTKSSPVSIRGDGIMAASFPPPAFLTSISDLVSQPTRESPLHVETINVETDKALLIMAANGRIEDTGRSEKSITFAVDGRPPTFNYSKAGVYFMDDFPTPGKPFPLALYQLAEVTKGTRTVALYGDRLSNTAVQIATIPVDTVQYSLATQEGASRTFETPESTTKTVLATEILAPSDSILVIAATFFAISSCTHNLTYYKFKVDGDFLDASVAPDTTTPTRSGEHPIPPDSAFRIPPDAAPGSSPDAIPPAPLAANAAQTGGDASSQVGEAVPVPANPQFTPEETAVLGNSPSESTLPIPRDALPGAPRPNNGTPFIPDGTIPDDSPANPLDEIIPVEPRPGSPPTDSPTPPPIFASTSLSMLAFARATSGRHVIELVNVNEGPCTYRTDGGALQVGVVPEVY